MTRTRIVWAVVAIAVLLLAIAPLASYCLGRTQDYRDKGELRAPPQSGPPVATSGPLIVTRD